MSHIWHCVTIDVSMHIDDYWQIGLFYRCITVFDFIQNCIIGVIFSVFVVTFVLFAVGHRSVLIYRDDSLNLI